MYHANEQFFESCQKPNRLEICSRGTHSNCRWMCVRVQMCRDRPFGDRWMAVRDDSAITRKENAAKVCRRSSSCTANSATADACTKSHRNEHPRQVGSCSIYSSSRRHVRRRGIGRHPRSPALCSTDQPQTFTRESRSSQKQRPYSSSQARTRDATDPRSCTKLQMPCLRSCQTPSSRTTVLSDRSPTSSQKHCDGCERTAGVDTRGTGENSACGM